MSMRVEFYGCIIGQCSLHFCKDFLSDCRLLIALLSCKWHIFWSQIYFASYIGGLPYKVIFANNARRSLLSHPLPYPTPPLPRKKIKVARSLQYQLRSPLRTVPVEIVINPLNECARCIKIHFRRRNQTLFTNVLWLAGPQCNRPMGMEKRRIRSQQISASSEWDVNHGARLARLNQKRTGRTMGAWSARVNNAHQWLQINMRVPMKVTSVATQGRSDASQWVTRYMLSYSMDGAHFTTYWSQGRAWVCYSLKEKYPYVSLLDRCHRWVW